MGTLAPWALLGREEIQVWQACLEHRGHQDSRSGTCYSAYPRFTLSSLVLTITIVTVVLTWTPMSLGLCENGVGDVSRGVPA